MADNGSVTLPMEENANIPIRAEQTEIILNDEKGVEFKAATLELDAANSAGGALNSNEVDVEFRGNNLRRDRPFSASRRSTASTKSKTSMSPRVVTSEVACNAMFAYQDQAFENAVEHIQRECMKPELDGETRGAWLLTEIDHWDHDKERLVILTDFSIIVVRYNFINKSYGEWKRIFHYLVDTLMIGDFVYPRYSLMPLREHGGIRLCWDKGEQPTIGQKWNPLCSSIPNLSLAHHPLIYSEKERETITYNVDDFCDSLLQATREAHLSKGTGRSLNVQETPILIESYASVSSLIFNQSHLGFNRDRNGVCF